MQALPPPRKLILSIYGVSRENEKQDESFLQIRINPWQMGANHGIWQGLQPSFGFPFVGIGAPQLGISIRRHHADNNLCIVRDGDFRHFLAV